MKVSFRCFLGVLLEQAEEHDGDLLGAQVLADQRHALGRAEDALDGADRALLVEVFLGFLAEGQAAVAAQGDDGGGPLLAFVVGNDLRLAVLEVGHDRVAGAEVDADVGHNPVRLLSVREFAVFSFSIRFTAFRLFRTCRFVQVKIGPFSVSSFRWVSFPSYIRRLWENLTPVERRWTSSFRQEKVRCFNRLTRASDKYARSKPCRRVTMPSVSLLKWQNIRLPNLAHIDA